MQSEKLNINQQEPLSPEEFFNRYIQNMKNMQEYALKSILERAKLLPDNRGVPIVCSFTIEMLDSSILAPNSQIQSDIKKEHYKAGVTGVGPGYLGQTGMTFYLVANTCIKD